MRLGLAGIGSLGRVHLNNFLNLEGAKVIALADKDPERRKGIFKQTDVNIDELNQEPVEISNLASYADYNELCVDKDIDAVCISLPTYLHADAAVTALEAGKHVFCEKPIALTFQDAQRMIDAAKASGKTLMVGQVLRFWAEYVKAVEIFSAGKYGSVLAASFYRYGGIPTTGYDNWFFDANKSGGAVIDLHLHDIDTCIWWWGKPAAISAGGAYLLGCPNIVHSRWHYENGPSVQFECFWDVGFPFNCGFRIIMENATLYFDYASQNGLQLITTQGSETIEKGNVSDAYLAEDKYFVKCIKTSKPVDRCRPEESLQSLECAIETSRQIAELKR